MKQNGNAIEARLWEAADELRANSKLRSAEYSVPVLGLVFLRYADHKFQEAAKELKDTGSRRRKIGPADYQAQGVLYLPAEARFSALIALPEGDHIGAAINAAMNAIEAENPDLKGVLPKTYNRFENALLKELLKTMNSVPIDIEGDAFGKIYEYFLGHFAMSEGQKGGEFFTPTAIVQLIVGIIEPFHGRIFDPACGSVGMFVQSAYFVEEHKGKPSADLSIFGQERVAETVRLGKMNLAVHGLAGDIRQGNTYYEDLHSSVGRFDFVMANPPFNVDRVDKERIKDDPRFPFGMPSTDNANYLWIQLFYSALADSGRAGFVMANSAADARSSELKIRQQLIETRVVDVMVAVGSNFFYTVTLPCTLWFFDKGKRHTDRADQVLFIDARHIYRQIDRAHRDWTPAQIEFLANIARLYRGEQPENLHDSEHLLSEHFGNECQYADVAGLCKVATVAEIEAQGWSLNPGRYVGVAEREEEDFDFKERLQEQNRDLLPKLISGEIDVSKIAIQTDWLSKDRNDLRRYDFFQQISRLPFVDKIVLFGSRARGDHHDRSDIDLAVFCDQASDEEWQQVLDCLREDRIDTLLKVDCVRFERSNAALKEHIMIEGKVLYEKNGPTTIERPKKRKEPTRMSENKLANHLSNSQRCLQRLDDAIRQPLDEDMFMLDAVVHRFNIAFELLMDTLLEYCVESDLLPKERVKEYELNARKLIGLAFDCKLIDDDQTWIAIKDARNATAHEYDEQQALAHYNKIKSYLPHLQALFEKMNTIADDVAEDVSN